MTTISKMDEPIKETEHWTARFSRPIIFVIITLIGFPPGVTGR